MKKKRFSVEQIVAVLKQADLGVPVAEVIRKVGISEQTFYRWKKQYVGMETDQARQMKQLQEENSRLKQLVADLSLDKTMLQDVLRKSSEALGVRRPMVDHLRDRYRAGERHACRVLLMVRGTYRYQSHQEPWTELRMRIREIAQSRVRYGYRKIRVLLNREGWAVGKHLVYRLYNDNADVESFNGTFRAECLNAHWFGMLAEAKRLIEEWRKECNESRPHRSLGERTPSEFASEYAASRVLTAT